MLFFEKNGILYRKSFRKGVIDMFILLAGGLLVIVIAVIVAVVSSVASAVAAESDIEQ